MEKNWRELTSFSSDGFYRGGSCLGFQLNESLIGLLNPPKSDKKMHGDSSPILCLHYSKTGSSNTLKKAL